MKSLSIPVLLSCLLCCATQTSGVKIESSPVAGVDGSINTELEETVSLTCTHDAADEADSELVWLRNDALVSLNEGNKNGQSKVCISPVILEDREAIFTCHLQSNATDRHSVILNVKYPPALNGTEEITVEEESTLALVCNIEANPAVSSIMWTLNGTEVDLKASQFSLTNDGLTSRLFTDDVQRSLHEGTFTCTAVSPQYGSHSKVFTVDVVDKTLKFPLWPMVAGIVVVCLTTILAIASRWEKIVKCCK